VLGVVNPGFRLLNVGETAAVNNEVFIAQGLQRLASTN
jgi:hypothetical protein